MRDVASERTATAATKVVSTGVPRPHLLADDTCRRPAQLTAISPDVGHDFSKVVGTVLGAHSVFLQFIEGPCRGSVRVHYSIGTREAPGSHKPQVETWLPS